MVMDFNKNNDGLVPAIIQDVTTKNVLMLGYMNEEAYQKTIDTKLVTFFSRTKNQKQSQQALGAAGALV